MINGKKTYRKIAFDKSKYKEKSGIQLFSHKIQSEDKDDQVCIKIKGVMNAPLQRCFTDFCSDQFVLQNDSTILSLTRGTVPTTSAPCTEMHTKSLVIKTMVSKMTDDKDFELHTCVWQNAKADKMEILSQTLDVQKQKEYSIKKYLPVHDIFSQLKLEKLTDTATEYLYIAVWEIPNFQGSAYERQLADAVRNKYIGITETYNKTTTAAAST